MIREEQAILMASQQVREDFPEYELGPMLKASNEDRCWYIFFRLYQGQDAIGVLYGVYRCPDRSWTATLFDSIPYQTGMDTEGREGRVEWILFQLRRMMKNVLETERRAGHYEDLEIAANGALAGALEVVAELLPKVVQDEVQKLLHGYHRSLFRYILTHPSRQL